MDTNGRFKDNAAMLGSDELFRLEGGRVCAELMYIAFQDNAGNFYGNIRTDTTLY